MISTALVSKTKEGTNLKHHTLLTSKRVKLRETSVTTERPGPVTRINDIPMMIVHHCPPGKELPEVAQRVAGRTS